MERIRLYKQAKFVYVYIEYDSEKAFGQSAFAEIRHFSPEVAARPEGARFPANAKPTKAGGPARFAFSYLWRTMKRRLKKRGAAVASCAHSGGAALRGCF